MASFNSFQSFANAMSNPNNTAALAGVNTVSLAQAQAKLSVWVTRVMSVLKRNMGHQYIHGFGSTGGYFSHVQQSGITQGFDFVEATVSYTPDVKGSITGGSIDVMPLLEHGFQESTWTPWLNTPYMGYRAGGCAMENTVSELAGAAAADGVQITLR